MISEKDLANVEIEDIYLKNSFLEGYSKGTISVLISLVNKAIEKKPLKLKLAVYKDIEADEDPLCSEGRMVVQGQASSKILIEGFVDAPRLWTVEKPFLYKLVIEITDHYDNILIRRELMHGFRDVQLKEEQIFMNGHLLKVMDAHLTDYAETNDFEPSRETYIAYLKHLKECNVNAIWTGREMLDQQFYDLCDSYGFYVFAEGHIEDGPRLVEAGKNHPSLIAWVIDDEEIDRDRALELKHSMIALDYSRPYLYTSKPMPEMAMLKQVFEVEWEKGLTSYRISYAGHQVMPNIYELWLVRYVEGEEDQALQIEAFTENDELVYEGEEDFLNWQGEENRLCHMVFEIRLHKNTWWQKRGYIVALAQYMLSENSFVQIPIEEVGLCHIEDESDHILVKGVFGSIQIDRESGFISQMTVGGKALLNGPIRPNMWRSSQDKALNHIKIKSFEHEIKDGVASISIGASIKGIKGLLETTYLISSQGEIIIKYMGTALTRIHHIGMTMAYPCDHYLLSFMGIGPLRENYHPIKSELYGVHNQEIDGAVNLAYKYKDVRWLTLSDRTDIGYMFEQYSSDLMQFYVDGQAILLETIEAPLKGESFEFIVKMLLLYE